MSVKLTASIWQEGKQYVSLCPELGVSSCGKNPEDALRMLKEAVELYVVTAKQLNINLDSKFDFNIQVTKICQNTQQNR